MRRTFYARERNRPERLGPSVRIGLTSLLIASGLLALAYQAVRAGHLEQTSGLFVGLPVLLGILAVNLSRTSTPFGRVTLYNIVFLAGVAPLLGEGAICLLMALPLFLAVSFIFVALFGVLFGIREYCKSRGRRLSAVILLPLLLGEG